MKKIFGTRRTRTSSSTSGFSSPAPSDSTVPPSLSMTSASPAPPPQGIVRPTPTYGSPSPTLFPPSNPDPYSHPTTTVATSPPARVLSPPTTFSASLSPPPFLSAPTQAPLPPLQPPTIAPQGQHVVAEADVSTQLTDLEGKLSVGIDFGTTFSGVAFGSNRFAGGTVRQILNWPGSHETFRKVPTCIVYYQPTPADEAFVVAWGLEASQMTIRPGFMRIEYFKLHLDPVVLRDGRLASADLPELPVGKSASDVVTDFLAALWAYAKAKITEEIGSVADLEAADVILTVPAAWDAAGCGLMREAAINAGMVQAARGGDRAWRDRLRIITEPEAAAIHASTLSSLLSLRPSQNFCIVDAGGGTVDAATYKLIGQLSQLEIAELCARTGANCGSLFLDLRFEALVKHLLRDHPVHLDEGSLLSFRHAFSEVEKRIFRGGSEDDATLFRFNCFNIEDAHDPSVGLEFGELVVQGSVLRREVFDPVCAQVLDLVEAQLAKTGNKTIHGLILVGGFAANDYLTSRIYDTFHSRIPLIARPKDCDVSTLQGAARYGLGLISGKPAVSSVIAPRSYLMKCKLPATDEDRYQRPGFITTNSAGLEVCENRLSYLVAKNAVLRKGQRLKTRFTKYSRNASDSIFTALLYVCDSDQIYRYTDKGEITELARWSVNLRELPAYRNNAELAGGGPFWSEFNLALVLDSAEVLGVLLTDEGEEVARATFEFLGNE